MEIEKSKVEMLSMYKDVIINNLESISYPLFNILKSDDALDSCEDYNKILELNNFEKNIHLIKMKCISYIHY